MYQFKTKTNRSLFFLLLLFPLFAIPNLLLPDYKTETWFPYVRYGCVVLFFAIAVFARLFTTAKQGDSLPATTSRNNYLAAFAVIVLLLAAFAVLAADA